MRSSRLLLSAVGVFVVFVLCVAYIVGDVLGTPLTSRSTEVTVELARTGGLFEGSAVTYRGVNVGKVTEIGFTATGVAATVKLTSGERIPADTRAVVRSLSPVGEQYLDFQPDGADGPWLEDGDRVEASATDVPRTLASTVISVSRLLDQVDADKLHTVLDEASKALDGAGDDLARLTDQGELLIEDLNRHWPKLRRVLHNGGTLLDIGVDKARTIRELARDFRDFGAFLRRYDPELARTLRQAPEQIRLVRAIVRDAAAVLPGFLGIGTSFTGLLAAYEPHLRTLLDEFAPGLGVLARAIRNGTLNLNIIGQKDHDCWYDNPARDPKETERRPMKVDGHCPGTFRWLQRGAAHAPGPVR